MTTIVTLKIIEGVINKHGNNLGIEESNFPREREDSLFIVLEKGIHVGIH